MSRFTNLRDYLSDEDVIAAEAELNRITPTTSITSDKSQNITPDSNISISTSSQHSSSTDDEFTTVKSKKPKSSPETKAALKAKAAAEKQRLMASGRAKKLSFIPPVGDRDQNNRRVNNQAASMANFQAELDQKNQEFLEREAVRKEKAERHAKWVERQTKKEEDERDTRLRDEVASLDDLMAPKKQADRRR